MIRALLVTQCDAIPQDDGPPNRTDGDGLRESADGVQFFVAPLRIPIAHAWNVAMIDSCLPEKPVILIELSSGVTVVP